MAINDALLSYLEEYEKNRDSNSSQEDDSVTEVVLNDNTVPDVKEEYEDTPVEKPKENKPFKLKINQNKKSKNDIMDEISKDVIKSQPIPVAPKTQEAAENIEEPVVVEQQKEDNSQTVNKIEQLIAEAKAKSKKKAEEEERLGVDSLKEHEELMRAIHKSEGVSSIEDNKSDFSDLVDKSNLDSKPPVIVEEFKEGEAPSDVSVEDLIKQAETHYKEEWLEVYNKGIRSRKNNEFTAKVRKGRFRIDKDHKIEILSDKRTDNKSTEELLNEKWL